MASTTIDIVKVYYATLSLMGAKKAEHFLAPDFTLVGWTAGLVDRMTWLRFLAALKQALPDLKFHLTTVTESGDEVEFIETGTGTHREIMDMSAMDLPDIHASGKQVSFPGLQWRFTVVDNKIQRAELISEPSAGLGLPGFVEAFAGQPAAVV